MQTISRFGVAAIMGRPTLYYGELRKMIAAENIVIAYNSRAKSDNWAEWVNSNPMLAKLLAEAEKLCHS